MTIKRSMAAAAILVLALCGCTPKGTDGASSARKADKPVAGGKAVVLLDTTLAGSWSGGLDPAASPNAPGNLSMMNAIYGGLFQLVPAGDGKDAHVEGVLAERHEVSGDGRDLTIVLRDGLKFSDGTVLDADAVKFNIERALKSKCVCSPASWPWAASDPVTTSGPLKVVLHFAKPYPLAVNAIPASNMNWVVSPSALKAVGEEAFKINPVGAGPFKIVTNKPSATLVLEKNANWWEPGKPYLDGITFQSIGGDQPAYQALLAGDADAYEGMISPLLLKEAEHNGRLTVTRQPPTSVLVIQLNTKAPPFNNKVAREAIYFATNGQAISDGLFNGLNHTSQSFTAEGGLYYHPQVPGYRTFDLGKAKSAVSKLGRLEVTLGTVRSPLNEQYLAALQTQWKAAGIDVHIETYDIGTLMKKFTGGSWQAMLQYVGAYDPAIGSSLRVRFGTGTALSGISDPVLDAKLTTALETVDPARREASFKDVSQYISDSAYAPFVISYAPAQVSRDLHAPGLTTKIPSLMNSTAVFWQDAWLEPR
jgi:peptide/nickel transport system substrate-binding protein